MCAFPGAPTSGTLGSISICPAPSPLLPPASPPPATLSYSKEASLPFGPTGEHKLDCKYTIGSDGQFDMTNTGCKFEMTTG